MLRFVEFQDWDSASVQLFSQRTGAEQAIDRNLMARSLLGQSQVHGHPFQPADLQGFYQLYDPHVRLCQKPPVYPAAHCIKPTVIIVFPQKEFLGKTSHYGTSVGGNFIFPGLSGLYFLSCI